MNRILFLDGFRAVAILMVVAFHYFHVFVKKYSGAELPSFSFSFGGVGVDLFFMISGFVIFMTVTRKDLKGFFISRLTRLYPVYIFSVCLTAIVILSFGEWYTELNLINFIKNLTMFQYYLGGTNIDGVYWSLRVEVAFYFALAIIYYGFKREVFWPALLIISLSSFIFNLYSQYFESMPHVIGLVYKVSISHFMPYFIIGMCVYALSFLKDKSLNINSKEYWFIVISLFISVVDLFVNKTFVQFFVVLIAGLALLAMCKGRLLLVKKVLENRVFLFIGKIRYSLYLVHQVIGYILILTLIEFGVDLYLSIGIVFIFVILLSFFMQKYIESLFSKALAHRLNLRLLSYAK
jgi:peptidoglycan/LPS O-acetylase OafA/YrhL